MNDVNNTRNILTLSRRKQHQLRQSVDIPFYLTIVSYVFSNHLNAYIYKIEYGIIIDSNNVSIKTIYKRYSEILSFYNELSRISNIINYNEFPGKIWFFRNDSNKIKRRCEQINKCLESVCLIHGIVYNDAFKKFIEE